jgi:hypothetical protein
MVIGSEEQLRDCFRAIDRGEVDAGTLALPIDVDPLFSWSVGPRAFLLFRDRSGTKAGGRPKGIVFRRNNGGIPDVAAMCEWCHVVRGHGAVQLLSAASDERHRVGLYLCADLGCLDKLAEPPGPDDLHEGLDAAARERKILARVSSFAQRRIF